MRKERARDGNPEADAEPTHDEAKVHKAKGKHKGGGRGSGERVVSVTLHEVLLRRARACTELIRRLPCANGRSALRRFAHELLAVCAAGPSSASELPEQGIEILPSRFRFPEALEAGVQSRRRAQRSAVVRRSKTWVNGLFLIFSYFELGAPKSPQVSRDLVLRFSVAAPLSLFQITLANNLLAEVALSAAHSVR